MGAWMKEQKEKKRAEARSRNAQAYAATSVAGVAAAVAALVAGAVFSSSPSAPPPHSAVAAERASNAKTAAALVASHCVEMAQAIGASHEQIVASIGSAVNAQTSGDVMALTAGAATALRGVAMLRTRLHKEIQGATAAALPGGDGRSALERDVPLLSFVSRGGELLKRTIQGILHWKLVTAYIDTNFQEPLPSVRTKDAATELRVRSHTIGRTMGSRDRRKERNVASRAHEPSAKWSSAAVAARCPKAQVHSPFWTLLRTGGEANVMTIGILWREEGRRNEAALYISG